MKTNMEICWVSNINGSGYAFGENVTEHSTPCSTSKERATMRAIASCEETILHEGGTRFDLVESMVQKWQCVEFEASHVLSVAAWDTRGIA